MALQNRCDLGVGLRHWQDCKATTHEVFQKRFVILAMPGKVSVALQACHAEQSASVSSISDKILSVASHIDENTTPRKNAPKKLPTGNKEAIAPQ